MSQIIPRQRPGYVYVIDNGMGAVKIGRTASSPIQRIRNVLTQSGIRDGRHWATDLVRDHFDLEAKAHDLFAARRKVGEWFSVPYDEACAGVQRLAALQLPFDDAAHRECDRQRAEMARASIAELFGLPATELESVRRAVSEASSHLEEAAMLQFAAECAKRIATDEAAIEMAHIANAELRSALAQIRGITDDRGRTLEAASSFLTGIASKIIQDEARRRDVDSALLYDLLRSRRSAAPRQERVPVTREEIETLLVQWQMVGADAAA